jgi:integrase
MKPVNVCKTKHHGVTKFRVCIPLQQQPQFAGAPFKRFDDRAAAEAFADQMNGNRQSWNARLLAYTEDDKARLCRAMDKAGTAAELEKAIDAWLIHRARVQKNLAEAVAEYVAIVEAKDVSDSHKYQVRRDCERLIVDRDTRNVGDLTGAEMRAYFKALNCAGTTAANIHTRINGFFLWAIKAEYCTRNPLASVTKPEAEVGEVTVLTIAEIKALMRAAHDHSPAAVAHFATLIFAGVRPAETNRLGPAAYMTSGGRRYLKVGKDESKTGARRNIYFSPALESWMDICPPGQLPKLSRSAWRAVVAAAGLKGPGMDWKKDVCRHSFVSYTLPKLGLLETSKLAGHSEQVLIDHYRLVVTDELGEEFAQLLAGPVLSERSNVVPMAQPVIADSSAQG